jgi:hypothetical protein
MWLCSLCSYVGLYYNPEICNESITHPCSLRSNEDSVVGVSMAVSVMLLLMYFCTLKTTLLFGCACSGFGVNGTISVPLLGRDAVDEAEGIMRKVYEARSTFIRRQ